MAITNMEFTGGVFEMIDAAGGQVGGSTDVAGTLTLTTLQTHVADINNNDVIDILDLNAVPFNILLEWCIRTAS